MANDIVTLKQIDHAFIHVNADRGFKYTLKSALSFYVKDYKFMPKYKAGIWDGKISLFSLETDTFPAGLIHLVLSVIDGAGYTAVFDDSGLHIPDLLTPPLSGDYTGAVGLFEGLPFEPYPYQMTAVNKAMNAKRRILLSPTGSGKSYIIYLLTRLLLNNGHDNILIVCTTQNLVDQMATDFEEYGMENSGELIHKIYEGQSKDVKKKITISTWQSIFRLGKKWFSRFTVVFGDEVHRFKASSLTALMNKCSNAEYRIGTSGTLDESEVSELQLVSLFGPVTTVATIEELQKAGFISNLDILCIELKHNTNETFSDYKKEIDWLISNERRNKLIETMANSLEGNTVVMFNRVKDHGHGLYERIRKSYTRGKVFYISGDVKREEKNRIINIIKGLKNSVLVASDGTFSTGVNIPNLDNLIFASPFKGQIRVLQSIGRVIRTTKGKTKAKVFDISDNINGLNTTLRHAKIRRSIYQKEKQDFKIVSMEI